jgi:hypothetical protein
MQGDAGDPILLTAGGDSMRSGAASVPALSDRLVLGSAMPRMRPATGGLVIEAITLRLVVTDDWLGAMRGPRRTLASWRFAAGDAAWAQAGIDVDERAPGGTRVMVARSREEEIRAAPPAPPRGGRPPPPLLRSAGQVIEIAAPVDFDLHAPGLRIDVDFALEARERLRRCSLVLIGEGDRALAEIGLEPFTPGAWIRRTFVPGDEIPDTAGLSPGQRVQTIALLCADAGQPFELRVSDLVVTCRGEASR